MKLHLPVALLTAVISAMAYGAEPAYTIDRTMGSDIQGGTYHDNDVIVDVTGGDFAKYNMGGDWTHRADYGAIQGASETDVMPHDHDNPPTYGDIYLNVSGGENISWLIGEGVPTPVKVTGDKNINVTGGDIDYIVGGVHYRNNSNGFTGVGNTTTVLDAKGNPGTAEWAHKDASNPDINISVTGGTVGQIRGGNNNKSDNVYNSLKYAQSQGTDLMTDKPWSVAGDVNISVGGDAVVGDGTKAIAGAGGSGHSVDGKVTVNVTGGTINGAIYGGSTNIYTEVGSTEVNISGGTINGNVYGGGNYDDGADKAAKYGLDPAVGPTVKGGSTVVLSGGTVNGSVYAAGVKDIVNAGTNNVGTHVVIKDGGANVSGIISGKGEGATVEEGAERLLTIENSGGINVSWNQFQDFNAVEFKNSEIEFGTLSKDFEKVSAEGSWLQGKFEDGEVQLNANNSWLEIGGSLTTTEGSSITNTKKPMTVTVDATFKGTTIENADLVAGGKMEFDGSSMNGGTISVGRELILNGNTDVVVDSINNGNSVLLTGGSKQDITLDGDIDLGELAGALGRPGTFDDILQSGSAHSGVPSLTVNSDLKLAAGSSYKGEVDKAANLTANSITTEGAVTFDKADVKATQGDIALSAGSTVTDSKLTAAENVTIGASSTVSGSTVTATAGNIDVTGSKLTNSDLYAREGQITISGSEVSTSGFYKIVGETVKIENSSFNNESGSTGLRISGNAEVSNGHFETSKGILSFTGGNLVLDSASTVNAKGGSVQFWSDIVTSNGAKLTTEDGHYQVHSQFIANEGTVISTGNGAMHFNKTLEATGTTITAGAGHIYTYDDVKLVGSTVKADAGNVRFGDKYGNDVISATGTTFIANEGKEIIFGDSGAVKVELNGGNKLMSAEGTNGSISFQNSSEVVSNGTNTIDAVVEMSDGTKLTAESGKLDITTHGSSSLQNLQQTGNAEINVKVNEGTLNLKGTSSIESLAVNSATSNITGSLTTTELVLNGGTMNVGTATGDRTELVLNIPGTIDTEINGDLNVTNTALTVKGDSSSQFWIGTGAKGSMTVTGGSYVDLSRGTTLGLGGLGQDVCAGKLTVADGSTLIGGSNNLWVAGNSEIHVTEGSKMYACSGGDHYNYRVLLGLTDDVTNTANQTITVDKGGSFTSYAYEFVSNFHPSSTVTIKVDGEGSTFTQENTMNCGTFMGTNKTTTYLVDSGYDSVGNKPNYVNDVFVNLKATNGGKIDFKSDVTYVGSALDQEKGKTNKQLSIAIDGNEKSSVSFRDMEIYANTVIENEGGSFTAEDIKVHEGAIFSHEGNGKITAASIGVEGTMLIGSEDGGRSQMTLYVPVTGTASYSGKINGQLTINNADFVVKGEVASQFGIGIGGEGSMLVTGGSDVNLSRGTTLVLGRDGGAGKLTVADGSVLKGGSNNLWVYGNSEIHVTEGSNMEVCSGSDHNNYRVLLGLTNTGDATTEQTILVDKGASFTSHAYEFVSHFHGGSTVNIVADGANSTFTQANTMNTGTFMGTNKTTTYLLDSGYDSKGNKYGAVDHVKANITASNGGKVAFDSEKTYVGSAQDKALGYTDKKLNITVADKDSSVSFKAMEIYADTTIDNKGDMDDFFASSVSVYDGATLETYGSLDLNDVAISGGTLYSHDSLVMDSLVMENATMLFAVSSLEVTQAMINYTGADLTGYRTGTISAADMIQNFGIVLSGAAVDTLMQQWETAVEFSFTLAQGSELFEKEFAYVLEQNLAEFTITLGEDALVDYALTVDNLKVVDDENGVHIIGTVTIPEPTTATLSLLALAALAARRRRK